MASIDLDCDRGEFLEVVLNPLMGNSSYLVPKIYICQKVDVCCFFNIYVGHEVSGMLEVMYQ